MYGKTESPLPLLVTINFPCAVLEKPRCLIFNGHFFLSMSCLVTPEFFIRLSFEAQILNLKAVFHVFPTSEACYLYRYDAIVKKSTSWSTQKPQFLIIA
jgi:hypothetical protein